MVPRLVGHATKVAAVMNMGCVGRNGQHLCCFQRFAIIGGRDGTGHSSPGLQLDVEFGNAVTGRNRDSSLGDKPGGISGPVIAKAL